MTARLRKREEITALRKKQITDAALNVFAAKGFGQATIADIAAAAGVGTGTIYNYYKNKHDLLISLIAETLISRELLCILNEAPELCTGEYIEKLFEERLNMGFSQAQKILFFVFEIQRDSKLRHRYTNNVLSPLLTKLENYINDQITFGNFKPVDAKIVSRTMVGSLIGNMVLYSLELKNSPFKKTCSKKIAQQMSDIFLKGLLLEKK